LIFLGDVSKGKWGVDNHPAWGVRVDEEGDIVSAGDSPLAVGDLLGSAFLADESDNVLPVLLGLNLNDAVTRAGVCDQLEVSWGVEGKERVMVEATLIVLVDGEFE
jgi:hypothetical protein